MKCLYRRDRANMPGSMREVKNAEEEGVEFVWLSAPEAFLGDETVAARARRAHASRPAGCQSGRQTVEPIEGSHFTLPADLVIKALGFDPEDLPGAFGEPELAVTRWGTLKIDHRSFMTSLPGVFAAGDIVRGASLVVWAIRDGRDAAAPDARLPMRQNAAVGRVAARSDADEREFRRRLERAMPPRCGIPTIPRRNTMPAASA